MSKENKFDIVGFIMEFEGGEATDEKLIYGFQHMINEGTVWSLQGFYGRTASDLIDRGICEPAGVWSPEDAVENYFS